MSSYAATTYITANGSSVTSSSSQFATMSSAQGDTKSHLAEVDENLYNLWEGVAGDNFRYASYTVETLLSGLSQRFANNAEALKETGLRFDALDAALENNLVVNYDGSSKGDN